MKVFSAAQIKACDAYTIHSSGISSLNLMERAAEQCVTWMIEYLPKDALFIVLCGTGNNGGDGLAIARILHQKGFGVKAFLIKFTDDLSKDCKANLIRLQQIDHSLIKVVETDTFLSDIPKGVIIIDAILGTGLNRPTEGWIANFIKQINYLPNKKIAVDIPSGMPADTVAIKDAAIIKANYTLSFQFYKRSFLHHESSGYTGKVHILDIGLDSTFIKATQTNYQIIDLEIIREIYQPREDFSHKGTYGTALVIGGSYGMMGAIVLAAKAALRSGAGKTKALIPEVGYEIFQTSAPEAMCLTNGANFIEKILNDDEENVIGIGPGLGMDVATMNAFEDFIDAYKEPLVIDADALNILSKRVELLHQLPPGCILTPHPKEYERLFGKSPNSMLRLEHARTQAMRYNIVIVLKGHYTTVVTPDGECWYNATGNSGLAKGGTGDVLTGIITALLAQKYEPVQAAMLGVYLHGLAADIALETQSKESLIPTDVIDHLGKAFMTLQ